jgi:light-regulated signal transduction histidine kinase (bacteriophytochrome)
MQALHPDDRDRIRAAWAKAQSTLTRYEAEGRLWNASLKVYRHFITRAVPILEGSGRVREWVGTVTDVHDRKLAEEEIQRLNSELEQRVLARTAELATTNQELESFTYSVSHDLRSPLRHIDAYAQILQEEFGGEMPEEATKYLTRIRNGTQNMGHLVDDLLNLARVGRQELNFKPASLRALVDEVIEEMADETKASTVEWTIGDLPTIPCDSGLIKQVFANLLSNAVKYSRPRPIARIEIGLTESRDQTAIFVRDNGVGFNMKYVSKLFGVFQRLHRAEEFEGTGVGLATVQRIVRKHGGEIWVESEVEKGATFYFTLKSLQTLGA